ncbi:uncharacterized protein [Periplaneta americana]|uniref:uncharacterized protein n=1 Tax=Periplaneta americana TaxID=6978 RepID=UPI0037E81AD3
MAITGFEGLLEADAILSDGTVCPTRYICKRGSREDEPVLVVTREVYESPNSKQILSSTLSRAGYLLQHTWMEGEYIVKVSPYKKVREGCVEKAVPLECVWEDDMELASKYLDCETQHRASHRSYLADHPEVRALLKDFMQATLLLKPSNVLSFATDFFGRFTFAQEYEPGPSTQLTTSLLDEVLGLVVRLAGRREVAAILETLLQRVLRRELDRNLLALLRDLCSSTTRLADILHAVIVVLEREGQVACVLSSLLIAAVPSGGEREMAELLADIVPHDVVEIVLKDILNSATTTTEYDIVKDKVTTATTRPDHDIIVDILQDILTTATAGAGHDVKVDILKEILTTINEGTRAEDNILQDLPEDEILQQDTAEDKTN